MVSVEFASITIAILLMYIFLYFHEVRWKRIVGCFFIMVMSVGLGVVADSIPLFVLMMANLVIALLKLVDDVSEILSTIK